MCIFRKLSFNSQMTINNQQKWISNKKCQLNIYYTLVPIIVK
jgi:hypothetical protein